MAEHSAEMLRCIRECDVDAAMRLWKHIRPHMPQPENSYQAAAMLHYARTQIERMPIARRYYSHCWLRDEGMPSALPDHLRPKAERMYPVGFRAVGIASMAGPGHKRPFNYAIEKVMADAVRETFADGHADQPGIVRARMLEMRDRFKRRA